MNIHIDYHKTKIGELIIGSFEGQICILDYRYRKMHASVDNRIKRLLKADFLEQEDAAIQQAKQEIDEYLAGERTKFDLPILLVGTDFQKAVWQELMKVPYGTTLSYMKLAERLGQAKAVRAVASANGANALALIVPCHRIIASDGSLGGYGGGLPVKKRLLKLEQKKRTLIR